jgi:hypothetical protein
MRIHITVVLFNKKLNESNTLISLISQDQSLFDSKYNLTIYDNSQYPCLSVLELSELERFYEIDYKHNMSNEPLSIIYKEQFDLLLEEEYLLILDDDSKLPNNYIVNFIETRSNLLNVGKVVFVPKVITHMSLISPYNSFFVFSRPLNANGFHGNIFAINSGVFIPKLDELQIFRYPEYAKFYGTDTVLFEFFHKSNVNIFVLDIFIQHDLSFHPKNSKEVYLSSLFKVIDFWRSHYAVGFIMPFSLNIYLFLLSVKLSFKYKSLINLFVE